VIRTGEWINDALVDIKTVTAHDIDLETFFANAVESTSDVVAFCVGTTVVCFVDAFINVDAAQSVTLEAITTVAAKSTVAVGADSVIVTCIDTSGTFIDIKTDEAVADETGFAEALDAAFSVGTFGKG